MYYVVTNMVSPSDVYLLLNQFIVLQHWYSSQSTHWVDTTLCKVRTVGNSTILWNNPFTQSMAFQGPKRFVKAFFFSIISKLCHVLLNRKSKGKKRGWRPNLSNIPPSTNTPCVITIQIRPSNRKRKDITWKKKKLKKGELMQKGRSIIFKKRERIQFQSLKIYLKWSGILSEPNILGWNAVLWQFRKDTSLGILEYSM